MCEPTIETRGQCRRLPARIAHSRNFVNELRERIADAPCRYKPQRRLGDHARQEGGAGAQGDGGDGDDQFIEQAVIVELADQFSAADEPDILPTRGGNHLRVHRADIPANEADVRAWNAGERT